MTVWQAAKADFGDAGGVKVVAVISLLVWMAFQWGFGNDAVLPTIASNVFAWIDNGDTWSRGLWAALCAGIAGCAFWAASQLIDAVVLLAGLKLLPHMTGKVSDYLRNRHLVRPYRELRWTTRWVVSFATGASVVCLIDVLATGRPGLAGRRQMIGETVVLSAGTVGLVTSAVVGAAMVAVRVPAFAGGAENMIRYARNPLTWIVVFSTVFLAGAVRSRWRA